MFQRIIFEDWTEGIPELSFWLTFGVFLAIVLRALFMKKEKLQHLENLPLEDQPCDNTEDEQS